MNATDVLSRLERLGPVQRAGRDGYRAACPVCKKGEKDTNLCVRFEGGRPLMWCHRCKAPYADLVAALDLNPRDLRPSSDWTPPARVEPTPDETQRIKLERTWKEAHVLSGCDVASRYLGSRGLTVSSYPYTLRCHPSLDYWDGGAMVGVFPALLARVENKAGELVALHKTYLSPDGRGKAPVSPAKKFSGPVLKGGVIISAVRLSVAGERLAVGEGLETSLAVMQVTGWPTWAALSCGSMAAFQWPSSVRELLIASDNDPVNPKTGQRPGQAAAHNLAWRALEAGLTVRLAVPPLEGQDWLDSLLEGNVSGLLEATTLTRSDVLKSENPVLHDKSIWGQASNPMSSNTSIPSSNQSTVWDTVSTPALEHSSDLGTHLGTSRVLKSLDVWERLEGIWGQALPPHSGKRGNGGER